MGTLEKNMTAQQRLSRLGSTSIQSRLGIFWDSSPCQRPQRNRGLTGIRKRKTALRASKVNKPRSSPQQVKRSGSRSEGDMSDDEVEIRCLPGYPKIRCTTSQMTGSTQHEWCPKQDAAPLLRGKSPSCTREAGKDGAR